MLYRTQHHSFSSLFNPFTFSSLSSSPHPQPQPLSLLNSSSSSSSSLQGMEGALKSSFRPETALKMSHHQVSLDDTWVSGNGQNGVSADDFFVDDLLDFSNGFCEDDEEQQQQQQQQQQGGENKGGNKTCPVSISVSPQKQPAGGKDGVKDVVVVVDKSSLSSITLSANEDFVSLPASELSVPAADLDSLEWLSHFVEDSFSEYSLTCPAGRVPPKPVENQSESEIPVQEKPCFTTPVQTKARTKRGRTGIRVWPVGSGSLTESSTSSSSCSSTTTMSSSPVQTNPWLVYPIPSQTAESVRGKPPVKKRMKKEKPQAGSGPTQQPRRCSHCGVQKTPQWRAGPMGAKTLCNACGVRFKSGRLLPEYRPACSPTFSSELHSNNHRKVLEMRRVKEGEETGLAPPVQSF